MAKGKHAQAKIGRDRVREQAERLELTRLIDRERALRLAAEERAREAADLRRSAATAREETDQELSSYTQRLREELIAAETKAQTAAQAGVTPHRVWERLSLTFIERHGGGREGMEALLRAIGGGGILTEIPAGPRLSVNQIARLQVIHGDRSRASYDGFVAARKDADLTVIFSETLRPVLVAETNLRDRAEAAVRRSTAWTHHRDALSLWWPSVWLAWDASDPFTWLPDSLGAVQGDDAPLTDPKDRIANERLVDDELKDAESRDLALLRATQRLVHPWDGLPRFSRPGDSALVRHHYATSGLGSWLRTCERPLPASYDTEDERTWVTTAPTRLQGRLARAAVSTRNAVPFWLPPGQTHAYASSEPLPGVDLDLLRMPFTSTLLTFAEPLRVEPAEPQAGEPTAAAQVLRNLVVAAEKSRREHCTAIDAVTAWQGEHQFEFPHPQAVFTAFGAWVEGLLFLAADDGTLQNDFAWLIALDGGTPSRIAARLLVPAQMDEASSSVAAMVRNLAAVVAWGDWHTPEEPAHPPSGPPERVAVSDEFRDAERRGAVGQVRVLNIVRTSGGSVRDADGPTRHVAPHMRRGHWRRQHHGPGRSLTKMVRIPARLINASRFVDVAPQIYRVPAD